MHRLLVIAVLLVLVHSDAALARQKGPLFTPIIIPSVAPVTPLAITPTTVSVPQNGQQIFAAAGGVPPYVFNLVSGTDTSGGARIDGMTGVYTAGPNPGATTVRVMDSATPTPASANATVTVLAQTTQVDISLDGRALGPGVTISIAPQGGGTALYTGLATDRVHELLLAPGTSYTLMAGAFSLDFTVTAACTLTVP